MAAIAGGRGRACNSRMAVSTADLRPAARWDLRLHQSPADVLGQKCTHGRRRHPLAPLLQGSVLRSRPRGLWPGRPHASLSLPDGSPCPILSPVFASVPAQEQHPAVIGRHRRRPGHIRSLRPLSQPGSRSHCPWTPLSLQHPAFPPMEEHHFFALRTCRFGRQCLAVLLCHREEGAPASRGRRGWETATAGRGARGGARPLGAAGGGGAGLLFVGAGGGARRGWRRRRVVGGGGRAPEGG